MPVSALDPLTKADVRARENSSDEPREVRPCDGGLSMQIEAAEFEEMTDAAMALCGEGAGVKLGLSRAWFACGILFRAPRLRYSLDLIS